MSARELLKDIIKRGLAGKPVVRDYAVETLREYIMTCGTDCDEGRIALAGIEQLTDNN